MQLVASPRQPAANGADIDLENLGDVLVGHGLHLSQDQDAAMLVSEPSHRRFNHRDAFIAKHRFIGSFVPILGLPTAAVTTLLDRHIRATAATPAERVVERDSIDPGEETTVTLECIQFDISLDERILYDILCLVGRTDDVQHGTVEAILVPLNQLPKCLAMSC